MTNLENVKSQWRDRVKPLRETGDHILSELEISAYIGGGFDAINVVSPALVAAVERVQALHEHVTVNTVSYCRACLTAYPCLTIQALEMK